MQRTMKYLLMAGLLGGALFARAERHVINGVTYECTDGMCMIVEDEESAPSLIPTLPSVETGASWTVARTTQGYMSADNFLRWLRNEQEAENAWTDSSVASVSFWLGVLAILLGGLAMNLTPCVLPMIPINLMIIGKSASRGAWYGLGIALAYGALGVAAAVGGLAFGTIQSSPWFNLAVAVLFVCLALALLDVFFIDLSRFRARPAAGQSPRGSFFFPLFMGAVSAVLAGACVAPILISVLLLTGKLYAEGKVLALGLPFVLGLGMALPWPFLGAGLQVLPKPGAWMKIVNRLFALLVFAFALWYGYLAFVGFRGTPSAAPAASDALVATPETFAAKVAALRGEGAKPILVDCWATWCKNCAAMDRVLREGEVQKALEGFTVVKLQAEDMKALNALKGFEAIRGLPAFIILDAGAKE